MNYMPSAPGSPSFSLLGQSNPVTGRTFSATGMQIVIGREVDCQLQIQNTGISRHHARITFSNGQWLIEDLQSANGTFLNGQRLSQPAYLRAGDTIQMGSLQFAFQPGAAVAPSSAQTVVEMPGQYPPVQAAPVYPPPVSYPPQQPVYYPPQPVYAPPPPKKKSSACLWIFLAVLLMGCVVTVIILLVVGIPLLSNMNSPQQILNWLQGLVTGSSTNAPMVSERDVITVSSSQSGMVTAPDGASIYIPSGSVPLTDSGESGTMSFSINQVDDMSVNLPPRYEAIAPVYELGPEGFTFNSPVTVVFPIPDDVDPEEVFGLTYYDTTDGTWKLVPGTVDADTRTVSTMTTHFSYWSLFGGSSTSWFDENGGHISVVNDHTYNTGSYDGGRGMPEAITYGVCVESYSLADPAEAANWTPPTDWKMMISDYRGMFSTEPPSAHSFEWWVPTGTYNLIEIMHVSEVNYDPLYVPEYTTYYRQLDPYTIETHDTISFVFSTNQQREGEWLEGRPDCFGIQDTSVGTGDVQITLTWNEAIDLDLHVIEPGGEEIYYGMPYSSTNGQLDRDNYCSNMVIGRPENIYWPEEQAPNGTYTVSVVYFSGCDQGGSVSYTVRIVVKGEVSTYTGTIGEGEADEVTTFEVP